MTESAETLIHTSRPCAPSVADAGRQVERPFRSVLFNGQDAPAHLADIPDPQYFGDLNLDQVLASLVAGRGGYRLEGYFRFPLTNVDLVAYRHEVFRDLGREDVLGSVTGFAVGMVQVRDRLARAGDRYHRYEKARWFLDAALVYADTVARLVTDLAGAGPDSRGLRGMLAAARAYTTSERYVRMRQEADRALAGLNEIRYDVWLHGARVTVGAYDEERNYSLEVARTFARFEQHPAEAVTEPGGTGGGLDPVEARILDQVALVFPDTFATLERFTREHASFIDPLVAAFDREVQFYLAYLDLIGSLREAGLSFELPAVSTEDRHENAGDTFDLALASQLVAAGKSVVTNDLSLTGAERILVITGPNNGGKTTTARTVGQLHHLAALGVPVPGHHVRLFLPDAIYTHFERREDLAAMAGKLQEELQRFADDFARATPSSLIVMNEMFSSTTVQDALFLSRAMLQRISDLGALGVCVTFLDELASFDETTVSMVSSVDPKDPAIRTFKVTRRAADGRAFARAIADKYGLTRDQLTRRVSS
ncbi:MAG: hypothetical protein L0H96_06260 [Humibacillus sp.]|nr:hypothetical protein [Humibacillus sp.]MDN5776495.1 hypothetical protein [Humibacillus sp.]